MVDGILNGLLHVLVEVMHLCRLNRTGQREGIRANKVKRKSSDRCLCCLLFITRLVPCTHGDVDLKVHSSAPVRWHACFFGEMACLFPRWQLCRHRPAPPLLACLRLCCIQIYFHILLSPFPPGRVHERSAQRQIHSCG